MRVGVIGANYVGLVVATCLADGGNDVVAVDIDEAKVERLRRGEVPFYEPGLAELVKRNAAEKRLRFSAAHADAVRVARIVFVCVGTPTAPSGEADLSQVFAAADAIAQAMDGYRVVVLKSTVPVGTADAVRERIAKRTREPFDVVSNPEFLKEGAAVEDFQKPDRIVIGTSEPRAAALMEELYAPFVRTEHPILVMDNRSAELTKYAANALLATRVSFMNEIANLAERVGADVNLVRKGVGADQRIGYPFLFPGIGYGGSCFPKDMEALIFTARAAGMPVTICEAARDVNPRQPLTLVEKVKRRFAGDLAGKTFAVWGLAFKPRTDDMREAPSLIVIRALVAAGARIRAYDPMARETARRELRDAGASLTIVEETYDALRGADALLLLTEWNDFRNPDLERIKSALAQPIIFDGRNIFDQKKLRSLGFEYFGIGTGDRSAGAG